MVFIHSTAAVKATILRATGLHDDMKGLAVGAFPAFTTHKAVLANNALHVIFASMDILS